MKLYAYTILVLIAWSAGCRKETVVTPPMRYDTAVVHVVAGQRSATSPVSGNYGVNPNGEVTGYGARLEIQDQIEVKHDFIGRGECPVSGTDSREWVEGDVYLFSILIGPETIVEPVVFRGKTLTVYERDEIKVTMEPANQQVHRTQ